MAYFVLDHSIHSSKDLELRFCNPLILGITKERVGKIDSYHEGSFLMKSGFLDNEVSIKVATTKPIEPIIKTIMEAKIISFDKKHDYRIKHVSFGEIEPLLSYMQSFEINILLYPFKYLKDQVVISRTSSFTIHNPGNIYALPRIMVYGTGNQVIKVNDKPITLNLSSGYLQIDSENMECSYKGILQNHQMIGEFPILVLGSNTISFGSGITKVEIEGRFRNL